MIFTKLHILSLTFDCISGLTNSFSHCSKFKEYRKSKIITSLNISYKIFTGGTTASGKNPLNDLLGGLLGGNSAKKSEEGGLGRLLGGIFGK